MTSSSLGSLIIEDPVEKTLLLAKMQNVDFRDKKRAVEKKRQYLKVIVAFLMLLD